MKSDFDKGAEGWQSYDYEASVAVGGPSICYPVTWEPAGGVNNSGFVWTDDSRWTIDTPEDPRSILCLILYREWVGAEKVDFRDAEVSVFLRGDNLDLKGGDCFFWAHRAGTRWRFTSRPLHIEHGRWAKEPNRFVLSVDESLWVRSWAMNPNALHDTLKECISYGFAFAGFSEKVTGRLAMDELEIRMRGAE